jgi:TPR repeat protein
MKHLWVLCFLFFVNAVWAQGYPPKVISGVQDMALSDQQISSYSEQALRGDTEAANRLGEYYLMLQGDRHHAEYWYRISAENGDVGAQRSYGEMLLQDSSENKTRAIFWLKKSAEGGDSLAKAALEKLKK